MPLPTITALPPAPSRLTDAPDQFVLKADAFAGALGQFGIDINALAAYLVTITSGVDFNSTSTTSLTIGTGSKTLTVQTGKLYQLGQFVTVASSAAPANYMYGQVTAYNSGTGSFTVNVTSTGGSGTIVSWSIGLATPNASLLLTGGTLTGKLTTAASTAGGAGLNIPHGTAPTAPVNGDLWTTTAGMFVRISGTTRQAATFDGTETLTNKTLTAPTLSLPVISGGASGVTAGKLGYSGGVLSYGDGTVQHRVQTADAYAITDAAGAAINPRNGTVQTWTLGASRTPTASGWADGDEVTLLITAGANAITWTTVGVTWIGGSAPTLLSSGATAIRLWQAGSTIYGAAEYYVTAATTTDVVLVGRALVSGTIPTGFSGSQTVSVGLTSLTDGIDTQARAGDFVVFAISVAYTSNITLAPSTSGYTSRADLYSNDSTDANLGVFTKFMSGTPDATVDIPIAKDFSNTQGYVAEVRVYRNVNASVPLDTTVATATGIDSVLANPPAATPATGGAMAVVFGAGAHTAGSRTFTASGLDKFFSAGADGTYDATYAAGQIASPLTTVDPAAFGFSTTDNVAYSWAAVTMILRKA